MGSTPTANAAHKQPANVLWKIIRTTEDGTTGIKDVSFSIYKLPKFFNPYHADTDVETGKIMKDEDKGEFVTTITTNKDGIAEFTAPNFNLYYVEETFTPDHVMTNSKAFFKRLPETKNETNKYMPGFAQSTPEVITVHGAALLRVTFEGKTIANGEINFPTNNAPEIEFYEEKTPYNGFLEDKKLATIRLSDNRSNDIQDVQANSDDDINISEFKGIIAISNLPVGKYYFTEKKDTILDDGKVFYKSTEKLSFNIKNNDIGWVDIDKYGNIMEENPIKKIDLDKELSSTAAKGPENTTDLIPAAHEYTERAPLTIYTEPGAKLQLYNENSQAVLLKKVTPPDKRPTSSIYTTTQLNNLSDSGIITDTIFSYERTMPDETPFPTLIAPITVIQIMGLDRTSNYKLEIVETPEGWRTGGSIASISPQNNKVLLLYDQAICLTEDPLANTTLKK